MLWCLNPCEAFKILYLFIFLCFSCLQAYEDVVLKRKCGWIWFHCDQVMHLNATYVSTAICWLFTYINSFSHQPNSIHPWTPALTASVLVHTAVWAGCPVLAANLLLLPETQSPPSADGPPSLHREGEHLNFSPGLSKLRPLRKRTHSHLHSFIPQQRLLLKRPPFPASLHLMLRLEVLYGETLNSRSQWCQHPLTTWREFTNPRVRKNIMC